MYVQHSNLLSGEASIYAELDQESHIFTNSDSKFRIDHSDSQPDQAHSIKRHPVRNWKVSTKHHNLKQQSHMQSQSHILTRDLCFPSPLIARCGEPELLESRQPINNI